MALELRQSLILSQQLVMTPQLQMAIKLLQLTRLELVEAINEEMEENPVLEEQLEDVSDEDSRTEEDKDQIEQDIADTLEVTIEESTPDDFDWENYLSEYNTERTSAPFEEKDAPLMASTCPPLKSMIASATPAARIAQKKIIAVSLMLRKQSQDIPSPMIADSPARRNSVRSPSTSMAALSTGGPPMRSSSRGMAQLLAVWRIPSSISRSLRPLPEWSSVTTKQVLK